MKTARNVFRLARLLRDIEVYTSLDPQRILRRQLNKKLLKRTTPILTIRRTR